MSTPSPTPPEPALQTAARLLAEGRPAAAAARLADLVAQAPTYAAAHVLRATSLEAAGYVDEAIVSWGRAAALVPRSPLVHRERERLMALRVADDADGLPPAVPVAPGSPRDAYVEAEPLSALDTPRFDDLDGPDLDGPEFDEPDGDHDVDEPGGVLGPPLTVEDAPPGLEAVSADATFATFEDVVEDVVEPDAPTFDAPAFDAPTSDAAEADAAPGVVGDAPASDADELDSLIAQLDDAPRIRPDPSYSGPEVSLDTPEVDDLASETLAEIYAAQHQYVEAAVIYEKLAARRPDQAEALLDRAAELRRRG